MVSSANPCKWKILEIGESQVELCCTGASGKGPYVVVWCDLSSVYTTPYRGTAGDRHTLTGHTDKENG